MPKFIDLTLTYKKGMRGFDSSDAKSMKNGDGWNALNLSLYSHSGTHMDAPVHFGIEGPTIDQIPISQTSGAAMVVDLSKTSVKTIKVKDVTDQIGILDEGMILLFRTGWSRFAYQENYRDNFPGFSAELAEWCVEKKVKLVGVEPPSVADVHDLKLLTVVHQTLFRGGVVIVEGLTNLDQITQKVVEFYALPLKISEGDGAPCRAFVVEDS